MFQFKQNTNKLGKIKLPALKPSLKVLKTGVVPPTPETTLPSKTVTRDKTPVAMLRSEGEGEFLLWLCDSRQQSICLRAKIPMAFCKPSELLLGLGDQDPYTRKFQHLLKIQPDVDDQMTLRRIVIDIYEHPRNQDHPLHRPFDKRLPLTANFVPSERIVIQFHPKKGLNVLQGTIPKPKKPNEDSGTPILG